jgi:hypothetical protein
MDTNLGSEMATAKYAEGLLSVPLPGGVRGGSISGLPSPIFHLPNTNSEDGKTRSQTRHELHELARISSGTETTEAPITWKC